MTDSTVRRAGAAVLGVLLAVGGTALTAPAAAAPPQTTAVIVQLTPGSDAAAESRRAAANGGGSVSHVYTEAVRGFAGEFTAQAIASLERNPRVSLVEADGMASAVEIQANPVWGLDRIDERDLPYDLQYSYGSTGSGVTAYVIDTGIAQHAEFGTRLKTGTSTVRGQKTTADCNGHGTHVAGTVAGTTYGVAKQASLVPVRVLDCAGNGTLSGVISGIDWTIKHHVSGPAVANMSLGGPANSSVDTAVANLVKDGVSVAVAAGNDNEDAAGYSPARVATAITVAATDSTDTRAYFSNHGSVVDLFAPGVDITSAWLSGGVKTISGTSMATPHVAGAAARLLSSSAGAGLTPAQVESALVAAATPDKVTGEADSPDRLLYVAP
jgi:subtilisin family serine protease